MIFSKFVCRYAYSGDEKYIRRFVKAFETEQDLTDYLNSFNSNRRFTKIDHTEVDMDVLLRHSTMNDMKDNSIMEMLSLIELAKKREAVDSNAIVQNSENV